MVRAARPGGKVAGQILRFGIVGGIGFLVDAGLLHLMLRLGLGYYGGRAVSFLAAASATWILNRSFTFRRETSPARHPAGEWLAYLGLMVIGGVVNYGTYALAVELAEPVRRYPVLGVALGSIAGMAINFWSAKTMVFERKAKP
ncbi:GtrA family protein [Dongia sedimenti]|uniref:GtrA family protein n=1 Tax=Dongia sedimenti TaxID=3064282 RepID=A0ABU0YP21_9PROT|nr:GtrA family protein [Rhodospirillaceae bacterium R-7]